MDIKPQKIKIRDLVAGYHDEGDEGVYGYGGKLDIRPPYQREFVYDHEDRLLVIDSVMHGFPLNAMYWIVRDDGGYEVMDGQQRTISICQYYNNDFSYDGKYFGKIGEKEDKRQKDFLDYELTVYFCSGDDEEKIKWFERINVAGKELSAQEMRNAVYHGPWVSDAKRWFSKRNCPAINMAKNYVVAEFERQGCLERAIQWFIGKKDDKAIREYVAERKKDGDTDASELWSYFSNVITWIEAKFKHTSDRVKILKGLDWGRWYAEYGKAKLDTALIEKETQRLLKDKDVTKRTGIIPYLLTGDERHLSIRAFDDDEKLAAYTRQGGKCPKCGKHFAIEEMQTDHITPWAKGGKTVAENCQMLCADCNRRKSDV